MSNLTVNNEIYEYGDGNNLLEIIKENNLSIENPCNGKGTCGKCKVKVISGEVNDITADEKKFLTEEELKSGIRLGCLVVPKGDISIKLLEKNTSNHNILTEGYMPKFKISPPLYKKLVNIDYNSYKNGECYEKIVEDTLTFEVDRNNLTLLRSLSECAGIDEITAVYFKDKVIGFERGNTLNEVYGIAIDIGTTTVVASLVDINKGLEIDCHSDINPQKQFGLDVLSRIAFIKDNEKGLELLHSSIIDGINKLIISLCDKNEVNINRIYEISIAANTTMQHILLGVNPISIGRAPYSPVFKDSKVISSASLGVKTSPFGIIYCLPSVSSYIGADIVAGVVVSELNKTRKNVLFIDIGTNGEIVLSKKGELYSCSCAAGPALEGMNISCGMRASSGAIEKIKIKEDEIETRVIDNIEPIGICGSGIIDAISEIVRLNLVNKTGRLKKKSDFESDDNLKNLSDYLVEEGTKRKFLIHKEKKEIWITQEDIRQVQLAKGAILSGFYALLEQMDTTMDQLDEVIIAGQFGKHLTIESLVGVGIIPINLKEKVRYIGNSSKTGAVMTLLSRDMMESIEEIARKINYLELSTKPEYERLFVKCLNF